MSDLRPIDINEHFVLQANAKYILISSDPGGVVVLSRLRVDWYSLLAYLDNSYGTKIYLEQLLETTLFFSASLIAGKNVGRLTSQYFDFVSRSEREEILVAAKKRADWTRSLFQKSGLMNHPYSAAIFGINDGSGMFPTIFLRQQHSTRSQTNQLISEIFMHGGSEVKRVVGIGKGVTVSEQIRTSVGEAIERAVYYHNKVNARTLGPPPLCDPYLGQVNLSWLRVSLRSDHAIVSEQGFSQQWPSSTNGWAVGIDATLFIRAAMEVLERDTVLLWWNTGCRQHRILNKSAYTHLIDSLDYRILILSLPCDHLAFVTLAIAYRKHGKRVGWAVASSSAAVGLEDSIRSTLSGIHQKLSFQLEPVSSASSPEWWPSIWRLLDQADKAVVSSDTAHPKHDEPLEQLLTDNLDIHARLAPSGLAGVFAGQVFAPDLLYFVCDKHDPSWVKNHVIQRHARSVSYRRFPLSQYSLQCPVFSARLL